MSAMADKNMAVGFDDPRKEEGRMLVLTRKAGETIVIGNDIEVTVVAIQGHRVRLGFTGPENVPIHRQEIYDRLAHPPALQQAECA
jgi:carbon storage regulator